jgi:intracellular sulfur oxidation DsrE/DsrF family protein
MFKIFALFALLSSSLVVAGDYEPQKVVYHINYGDESRIGHTFSNISNHINELGEDNVEIKAVIHGEAIEYFMSAVDDTAKQGAIDTLKFMGAKFVICGNSLTGYKIGYDALYDVSEDDVVKAGLPEIVRLQQQGYIYVRP